MQDRDSKCPNWLCIPNRDKPICVRQPFYQAHRCFFPLQMIGEGSEVMLFEQHRKEYIEIIRELRKKHPNMEMKQLEEMAEYEVMLRRIAENNLWVRCSPISKFWCSSVGFHVREGFYCYGRHLLVKSWWGGVSQPPSCVCSAGLVLMSANGRFLLQGDHLLADNQTNFQSLSKSYLETEK